MIHGMVMPILYFPSSFLIAFSSLLIPEMSEANACGHKRFINRATSRSFQLTLLFSIFVTSVFLAFSHELGMAFYQKEQAGTLLRARPLGSVVLFRQRGRRHFKRAGSTASFLEIQLFRLRYPSGADLFPHPIYRQQGISLRPVF